MYFPFPDKPSVHPTIIPSHIHSIIGMYYLAKFTLANYNRLNYCWMLVGVFFIASLSTFEGFFEVKYFLFQHQCIIHGIV